ncbi:MAG: hypothetical protein ABI304_12590 [Rudaea sp.]
MRVLIGIAGIALVVAAVALKPRHHAAPLLPPPTDSGPGESDDFARRRQAWIESLHAHAPGVDWRAMDAATSASLDVQRNRQLAQMANGYRPQALTTVPAGVWRERGARNQAGRVSDVDYDAATDRLTVFAHGGQLWRSLRSTLKWQPLNDARHFKPNYELQNFVRMGASGVTPERWIAADDTQHGLYYSDDQGATWHDATGVALQNWVETSYLFARDTSATQVYALVGNYNFTTQHADMHLLVSNDRGTTYIDSGVVGTEEKTALVALAQGSGLVYLLQGSALKRIETNNTLTTIATIAGTPTQSGGDKIGLAGGVTTGATPTPFLYAFYEASGATQVFQSFNAGATWTTRGSVPQTGNIRMAVGTSLHSSNLVFCGGINLYRSDDGGQTFAVVNAWSEYYDDIVGKLHADISFVKPFANASNNEVFFVGTDGGLFQSTDGLQSVKNISLTGMRQAQYYDSYTGRNSPYAISIGTQDQGYQRNSDPPSGIANFTQVISGDFAHLTSSDDGATVWMNYPGFTQIDPAPATANIVLPAWQFDTDGNLQNTLFLPPLMADPSNPHNAWLGGGASVANVNHVIKLAWNGSVQYNDQVTSSEGTFDFGGQVTALAYSPQSPSAFFAMANNSSGAASFFNTTTPLSTWTQTVATLPQGQFFYGQSIVPDPSRAGVIYICGSGYSGPGVYVSSNNGGAFTAMNTGLPDTLVYSLAISPDGANLFAATEVGPFYFDRAHSNWVDIGAGAPDNIYWNVDFIPALNTARFSTYGRGLWDYDLGGGDLIFRDDFE